jgi:DNA-binding MurR/RpiR family transcriptional regulator
MGNPRERSIEARIHDLYETLPDSERKLADVILGSPGDLSSYTATELTSLAGVSKAAGTRLFRRLGFNNYEEARLLARETLNWGSPLYIERKGGVPKMGIADYVNDEIGLLKKTLLDLKPDDVDAAAEALIAARRVFLMGHRNSHVLAGYMRWQLIQFRGDVHMLPAPGETLGEYLADLTSEDLLVVFALRRRVARLDEILAVGREKKARILLVTDSTARGIPAYADWTFTCEAASSFVFDSCGGALSVARYLSIQALQKAGNQGRKHLERVERQHEKLAEFK